MWNDRFGQLRYCPLLGILFVAREIELRVTFDEREHEEKTKRHAFTTDLSGVDDRRCRNG